MKTNRSLIFPYLINTNKLTPSSRHTNIKYHMGWLGIFSSDDSDDNKDKKEDETNDSGVSIDWDVYDRINNQDNDKQDRGVIEVPASSETIIYESPDGETYEISISDLIEADDDNEIEYKSTNRHSAPISKSASRCHYNKRSRQLLANNSYYLTTFLSNNRSARIR